MESNGFGDISVAILWEMESALAKVEDDEVRGLVESIVAARRVFFVAAGRSRLVLGCMAMRLMQLGITTHMAGEVTAPAVARDDLVISASGSGETVTTVAMVNRAIEAGSKVAVITAHGESTLSRLADVCVRFSLPEKSVQVGAAAFEQALMVFGDALVIQVAKELGIGDVNHRMRSLHANLE